MAVSAAVTSCNYAVPFYNIRIFVLMAGLSYCILLGTMILAIQGVVFPFPSSINVPRGTCVNNAIGLGGLGSNLILSIQPRASPSEFNVSSNLVTFSPASSNASITFCASQTTGLTSVPIALSLSGPESANYQLASDTVFANVVTPGAGMIPTMPAGTFTGSSSATLNAAGTGNAGATIVPVGTLGVPLAVNMNNLNTLLSGNIPGSTGVLGSTVSGSTNLGASASTTGSANINSLVPGLLVLPQASPSPTVGTTAGTTSTQAIDSLIPGLVPGVTPVPGTVSSTTTTTTTTSFGAPSLQIQLLQPPTRNSAQFLATTNSNGMIYYSIQSGQYTVAPVNQTFVKTSVQSGQLVQQSSNDMLTLLYVSDRELRFGSQYGNVGVNYITLTGLRPSKVYTFCAYQENASGMQSPTTCTTFTTAGDQSQRANFYFNRAIQASEMNRFMCFLSTVTNLPSGSIVNMLGDSCNTAGQFPLNNNYRYIGTTMYPLKEIMVFYLTPNTSDPMTSANFVNMFESRNINAPLRQTVKTAALNNGVDFIDRGMYGGEDNLVILQSPNSVPTAVIQSATNMRDGRITVPITSMSGPGTLYMVALPTGETMPSAEQILNCRNGNNQQTTLCGRVPLLGTSVIVSVI